MKTKHILFAVLLIVAASLMVSFTNSKNVQSEEPLREGFQVRVYDFQGFESIDVSSIYDVTVTQSDVWSVNVECSDDMKDHLRVNVDGGTLVLAVNGNIMTNRNSYIKASISMPNLKEVDLSGACNFSCKGKFNNLEMDCSGASDSDWDIVATEFEIDASGSSDIDIKGQVGSIEIDASGASDINLKDLTGSYIELDLSGASTVNCKGSTCFDKASVELSGASDVYIKVTNTLELDLSGASDLKYSAPSTATIITKRLSGSSSLIRK